MYKEMAISHIEQLLGRKLNDAERIIASLAYEEGAKAGYKQKERDDDPRSWGEC